MAKYWNNDQGITSLGVSASISRVVNQSASPLGSTMARGLGSPTGPRAFLGAGSGPGWLLAVAPVPSVSTISPHMRCHWQHQLGRPTMLLTAWVCGPSGSWDRRTQVLPLRAHRPRLHPELPPHSQHHRLQLPQPNQLQRRLKMTTSRMWNLRRRREQRWLGLRRSVPLWNGE